MLKLFLPKDLYFNARSISIWEDVNFCVAGSIMKRKLRGDTKKSNSSVAMVAAINSSWNNKQWI